MKIFILIALLALTRSEELQFVGVVIRHGARAALAPILILRHRIHWPTGYGELTAMGQRQHYLLGRHLRRKYIEKEKFLPEEYDASLVYSRSTYYHRTAMSAESFVFGLYPDAAHKLTEKQMRDETIWKPPMELGIPDYIIKALNNSSMPYDVPTIPVRTFTKANERLVAYNSCPMYNVYRQSFYNTDEFTKVYKKYEKSFKGACDELDLDCDYVEGFEVFNYVDFLLASEFDGQLPELSDKPEYVENLLKFYTELMIGELTMNKVMKAIAMHEFSKVFPELFENATKGGYKMVVLGTHDSTVLAYLLALGVDKEKFTTIPYAANIIVELRKLDTEQIVTVLYNGEMVVEMAKSEFNDLVRKIGNVTDWDKVCTVPKETLVLQANTQVGNHQLIAFASLCAVIGVIAAIIYKYKKDYNPHDV
eukprot:TRINITY_DN5352_c0_g2_i2.p1 TRINITY_DN5352_c0_g2~~TRINITY_DN5352_c0_g2_i2.p1  ORF type:complete len:422 (-),score=87.33 TRINITY_DN5352_c0_g2_i2:128-1393(-)